MARVRAILTRGDLYLGRHRWSFPLQIYVLGKRFETHHQIAEGNDSVIQDRSVYEDRAIFARHLHRTGTRTSTIPSLKATTSTMSRTGNNTWVSTPWETKSDTTGTIRKSRSTGATTTR